MSERLGEIRWPETMLPRRIRWWHVFARIERRRRNKDLVRRFMKAMTEPIDPDTSSNSCIH